MLSATTPKAKNWTPQIELTRQSLLQEVLKIFKKAQNLPMAQLDFNKIQATMRAAL